MAGFALGPQVGFPAWTHTVEQPPNYILAEEGDQIRGDSAFQFQRGAVLEATAFAGLAHRPAFHQHEDGDAVAWRMRGEE